MNKIRREEIFFIKKKFGRFKKKLRNFSFYICLIIVVLILFTIFLNWSAKLVYLINGFSFSEEKNIDIFSKQDFSEIYKISKAKLVTVYEPFLDYKLEPLKTEIINMDENSTRYTLNPCKNADSLKIFMFGGSVIWGAGARDDHTISSEFSKLACERGLNVEVTNFGDLAYVSNQEVINFLLELKKNNVPDLVIFLTGANDVHSAYHNFRAGVPLNYQKRKYEYNKGHSLNLRGYINNFPIMTLIFQVTKKLKEDISFEELSAETVSVLESNLKLVKSLEDDYNFKSFFFLQPVLCFKKILSDEEKSKIKSVRNICPFWKQSYDKIGDNFIDFSNIFDNESNTVYYDYGHLMESYNKVIAEKMIDEIPWENL